MHTVLLCVAASLCVYLALAHDATSYDLAPPPMTDVEYAALRACVERQRDATTCFPQVSSPPTQLGQLRRMGMPTIVLVPDCWESVLWSCADGRCEACYGRCTRKDAALLGPLVGGSGYAVEEVLGEGQRHGGVVGGSYAVLVRALLRLGYEDGSTLRAAAWDARGTLQDALAAVQRALGKVEDRVLTVARGTGCALAAQGAGQSAADVAVLCLAAAPDGVAAAGVLGYELGLTVRRRRGRPLPAVDGPWGSGTLVSARCKADEALQLAPTKLGDRKALCVGDCARWLTDARRVDCNETDSVVQQFSCLVNVFGG